MKILLVGGGTAGSVSPLLAVAGKIKQRVSTAKFLFVGTKTGPERQMAEQAGIFFVGIVCGKWRRYFSLKNFLAAPLVLIGFFQALKILKKNKPQALFGGGSFVQVPVVWAAWFLKIPVVLHQQDIVPSLANRLCQCIAKKITVTFEKSLTDFQNNLGLFYSREPTEKNILTGNPSRYILKQLDREKALKFFALKNNLPALLVLGGGTGAEFLNTLVIKALPNLFKTIQIIHCAGLGKQTSPRSENYFPHEFITRMDLAYAAADFVLCRAGLSTITELSSLQKISIMVPLPKTHQEYNAALMAEFRAAIVVEQKKMSPQMLIQIIRKLLFDIESQNSIKRNLSKLMPKNSAEKISEIIINAAKTNYASH